MDDMFKEVSSWFLLGNEAGHFCVQCNTEIGACKYIVYGDLLVVYDSIAIAIIGLESI